MYIYIHIHVFRPTQDSSVWLGLTSREQLMSPECSKHQVLSLAKMLVVNEQKIFCSHHCSPECSMNKLRAYISTYTCFILISVARFNEQRTTLVTFDVKSLDTGIPDYYGLEAICFWIKKHPDSIHSRFSKGFVLVSIKAILENNNCIFNDEFYRQISGTGMGKKKEF